LRLGVFDGQKSGAGCNSGAAWWDHEIPDHQSNVDKNRKCVMIIGDGELDYG
jgi:hypothetical protein